MSIVLKKICVPTDFSEQADHALLYGRTLAKHFGAELHLLHVVEDMAPVLASAEGIDAGVTSELLGRIHASADQRLKELEREDPEINVIVTIRNGVAFHEITNYAKSEAIDMLIMGTHGRSGLKHFLIGSVAERVVRSGPCPVLTVRHPEHEFVIPDG